MFALNVAAHNANGLQGKGTLLGPLQLARGPGVELQVVSGPIH